MKTAVFFVGELNDNGFNSSALAGARRASAEIVPDVAIISGIPYDQKVILDRLRETSKSHEHIVFVGGQGNLATPQVAAENPEKLFTIIQGDHASGNVCSYDVRQEESAFLAGCLAARLSKSGTIAHLSGHRVKPGLKGRAAFVSGAAYADPNVVVLTSFCGTQDDNRTTCRWAKAQFENGADIVFTMLNGARQGAIDACRETRNLQIGNVLDWVAIDSDVFVGSALARIDLGVEQAIRDALAGTRPDSVVPLGIAQGTYASLSFRRDLPEALAAEIGDLSKRIGGSEIVIPSEYEGEEFVIEEVA